MTTTLEGTPDKDGNIIDIMQWQSEVDGSRPESEQTHDMAGVGEIAGNAAMAGSRLAETLRSPLVVTRIMHPKLRPALGGAAAFWDRR